MMPAAHNYPFYLMMQDLGYYTTGTNRTEEVAELLVAPAQLGSSSSTVDFEDEICHFEASKKQRLALSCIAKQGKEIETRNDPLHTSELGTPKAREPSASEAIEIKTKLGDEISQLDKWNHTKYHAVGAYPVANQVPSNNIFVSNRIGKMGSNSYSANTNGYTVSHEPSFSCTPARLSEKEIHLRPRWQKGSEVISFFMMQNPILSVCYLLPAERDPLSSPCYVMPHVFMILGKALGVFFDRHQ
jgi:hypothetical protein